jgi:hypothetical protein
MSFSEENVSEVKEGRRKMNMQCEQFERILEQQDEGTLPQPALSHVDECESCRSLFADIGEIRGAAMELGAEGIAPPERIWVSLRNQLEAEGIIHDAQDAPQPTRRGWWSAFQRSALAGAFLALILVAATTMTFKQDTSQFATPPQIAVEQNTSPIPSADSVFKEEVLTVGNDSVPGMPAEDAAVTASIRRNLGIVDNFIAMCEKSVREQPDNEMAREYLYGAYEQKAELLATATSRSLTGGLQ